MDKNNRNNTVIIIVIALAGCLLLLCGAVVIFFFFFGVSTPVMIEEPPTETTTLNEDQLEQCRELLAIVPEVELEGEYYLYTPGFLDDSMECHLQVRADSVEDIFDLSVVDPSLSTTQEVAPGRHVRLTIQMIEPGLYRIEGVWFQT
ncbi:hypothetical protein [Candidatus Leptofilum sp.]|uniref:hypothetical protein n=1 Tax=Candidatus Leptofilum sp. TaxID=3241576 RepID=UPI003B5C37FA